MHTFQINTLIKFFNSTRFEPHRFILGRQLVVNAVFIWYVYVHWCKQSSRWKSVFDRT